jgi:hypothetical protein
MSLSSDTCSLVGFLFCEVQCAWTECLDKTSGQNIYGTVFLEEINTEGKEERKDEGRKGRKKGSREEGREGGREGEEGDLRNLCNTRHLKDIEHYFAVFKS